MTVLKIAGQSGLTCLIIASVPATAEYINFGWRRHLAWFITLTILC